MSDTVNHPSRDGTRAGIPECSSGYCGWNPVSGDPHTCPDKVGCLIHGAEVESEPHPSFIGGRSWTCARCEQTFSEPHPTSMGACPHA